jgi:DNA-directed RNA polymerase subunit E'/Rpb7
MHFNVAVNFLVFRPSVDDIFVGVVNKVSPDHIGCLVYGFFNASLAADQFTQHGYQWDHDTHSWTSIHGVIGPGSVIKFSVIKYLSFNQAYNLQ